MIISEGLEDDTKVDFVFFDGVGEEEDIVQVCMDKYPNVRPEYVGHQPLECRGGITIPLLHHAAEHRSEHCGERGLGNVFRFDPNLLIRVRQVNF